MEPAVTRAAFEKLLSEKSASTSWDWDTLSMLLDPSLPEEQREALIEQIEDHPDAIRMLRLLYSKSDSEWQQETESSLQRFRDTASKQDSAEGASASTQVTETPMRRTGLNRASLGWYAFAAMTVLASLLGLQNRQWQRKNLELQRASTVQVLDFFGTITRAEESSPKLHRNQSLVLRLHLDRSWTHFSAYQIELWSPQNQRLERLNLVADEESLCAYFPKQHFQDLGVYRVKLLGVQDGQSKELNSFELPEEL